jgi:sulfite reductase (NADPH) flavoprotein alpha-component
MTTNAALAGAPFSEDQLAQLKRLLGGATHEQRVWLSGYIAGLEELAAPQAAAPAAPPAAKAKLTILYATESGNAEALAGAARKAASRQGFNAKTLDMADATPDQIAKLDNVLLIASTWGEGDPPQRAEAFYAALMAANAPRLERVKFAVLALGDRAYAQFCETGRRFDARFEELGATRLAPVVECDLDYKKPASAWIETTLRLLDDKPANDTAVIRVAFPRPATAEADEDEVDPVPFAAEVSELINLNSSRSDIETYHVTLSLEGSGIAYEPGDSLGFVPENDPALVADVLRAAGIAGDAGLEAALRQQYDITLLTRGQVASYATLTGDKGLAALAADEPALAQFLSDRQFVDLLDAAPHALSAEQLVGLLRPLPPRLYSVASSRKAVDDEAHLLVAKVQWDSHGRARRGVASGQVADRLKVGDTLPVTLKANPHFRLPDDPDRPVIMIGPGTGVAPFRAFLQEREAVGAGGRNWLFFGARRSMHDFLYQLDWQDWQKSGLLSRIDLAFSRDQREKNYVQHRMWDARAELYAWLRDGAAIYVCGDAKAMAKDVHTTLLHVIADQSGAGISAAGLEAATNELRTLQRDGRYKRDVY